jgi:hypothetical protein
MSLLLALTGGAPTSLNATIAWTQQSSTWSLNGNALEVSSISWTQADSAWLIASNAEEGVSVAWTQQGSVWAISSDVSQPIDVTWTQDSAVWAITANAGAATDNVDISWTQDDATWAIAAFEQPDTNWWPLVGGAIDRRRYEEAPEVLPIIEAIAKEQPKAPVKELRDALKKYDIAYDESYKKMLQTIIKAKKQADEEDDEQAILMLL